MTPQWIAFSLLAPVVVTIIAYALRNAVGGPLSAIAANAVVPGAGLALLDRPLLEIVVGVLIAIASLLSVGGASLLGMYVPVMIAGGVWASLYTPLSPLRLTAAKIAATTVSPTSQDLGLNAAALTALRSPAREASPTEDAGQAGYRVVVRCTECGAGVEVPVLHRMAHCSFCGSTHLVIGHDETLFVTIPEKAGDEAAVRDAVLDYYRYQKYLKIYARQVAPLERQQSMMAEDGTLTTSPEVAAAAAAAERLASARADAYRARLAATLKVAIRHHFLAPYRHGMGTLYQASFGRSRADMEKKLEFSVGALEASVLGSEGVELPKMGHLSYLRAVVPAAEISGKPKVLALAKDEASLREAFGDLDRKQLSRNLQVIRLGGSFVPEVQAVVWRPWWIVDAAGAGVSETLLVDAAAGSVAGPAPAVAPDQFEELPAEVLEPGRGLRFIPMECPTCGHEFRFDVDAVIHFCDNCHRAFAVEGRRKAERPYDAAPVPADGSADLVPFWRFPLRLRTGDGDLITDLMHLKDGIDGTLDQLGEDAPVHQEALYVPAIRLINARLMTAAYRRLLRFTVRSSPEFRSGRFPLDEKPHVLTVSLAEDEARRLAPFYLATIFGRRDLARVNVHQVASWLFGATLEGRGRLTYLAVPRPVTEPFRNYVGRFHVPAVAGVEGVGGEKKEDRG